jgi:ureidoglycolate lyase
MIDIQDIAYTPTTGVRRRHDTPLVAATAESLEGYGRLVDDPANFPIEIVRWPAQGWRPIDLNSGDQGGVTEGLVHFEWRGQTQAWFGCIADFRKFLADPNGFLASAP